jgi:hypothetical protein
MSKNETDLDMIWRLRTERDAARALLREAMPWVRKYARLSYFYEPAGCDVWDTVNRIDALIDENWHEQKT